MEFEPSNLKRKASIVIIYNAFGAIFGYISLFFVYRFVGQSSWGIVGSATALVGIISIIADLGVSSAHIKKLPEHKGRAGECLGAYTIIKSILTNIFLLISIISIYVFNEIFGIRFESKSLRDATILIVLYYYIDSISQIFRYTQFSLMKVNQAIASDFVKTTVQNSLIIAIVLLWLREQFCSREFVGVLFTYAYVLGAFSGLLVSVYFGKKYEFRFPSKDILREYKIYTFSLMLFGILNTLVMYTDRAMIQIFWDSYEVGGYFGIQKIAQAITFVGSSVMWVVYPAQSYHSQSMCERFEKITLKAEKYISIFTGGAVAFGIIFAEEILNIWNKSLVAYSSAFILLLLYSYIYAIALPYTSLLVSVGKPQETLKIGLVQAVFNVILNLLLIPGEILGVKLLGLKSLGAAIATLISFSIGFIFLKLKISKNLGIRFNYSVLKHVLAAGLAAILIFLLKLAYTPVRIYELLVVFLIFSTFYVIFLIILREIKIREILSASMQLIKFR